MFNKKDPLVKSVVGILQKSAEDKKDQKTLSEGSVVPVKFDQDSKDKSKIKKFSKALTGKDMDEKDADAALASKKAGKKKTQSGYTLADIKEEIRDNLVEKLAAIYEEKGEKGLDEAVQALTEEQVEILGFNNAETLEEAGGVNSTRGVSARPTSPIVSRTRNLATSLAPIAQRVNVAARGTLATVGRQMAYHRGDPGIKMSAQGNALKTGVLNPPSSLRTTLNANQITAKETQRQQANAAAGVKPAASSPISNKPVGAKNTSSTSDRPKTVTSKPIGPPPARPMGTPLDTSPGEMVRQSLGGPAFASVKPVAPNRPTVKPIMAKRPMSQTSAAQDTMANLMRESLETFVRNKFLKD